MLFAIPVVWREPSSHSSDCYFCLMPPVASGMGRKKKQRIDYPNIPSAIRPVPHGEDLSEWNSRDKAHHYVKRMAYQKDFGARTQKCKASFTG